MPVLSHPVHESVKQSHTAPYGCANMAREQGYVAPNRVYPEGAGKGYWTSEVIWIPDRLSKECRYDKSLSDPRCGNCRHAGTGEQYAKSILEQGS